MSQPNNDPSQGNDFVGKTANFLKNKGEQVAQSGPVTQITNKIKDSLALEKLKDYGNPQRFFGFVLSFGAAFQLVHKLLEGQISQALLPGVVLAVGLGLFALGIQRKKAGQRMIDCYNLIGKSPQYSLSALEQVTRMPVARLEKDVQTMISLGVYRNAFYDKINQVLVLKDVELYGKSLEQASQETTAAQNQEALSEEGKVLQEICTISAEIHSPEISAHVDKIGALTAKIFEVQRDNPEKSSAIYSFLSYYLPTTLKIMRSYQQLEEQGVQGENITSAMNDISNIMDKLVEGYEKQLDQLFQPNAMDIATDISVLEQMMARDGLTNQGQLRL